MRKKLLLFILLVVVYSIFSVSPKGVAIGYIGDSIRIATYTSGNLSDTLYPTYTNGRTTVNDQGMIHKYNTISSIIDSLGDERYKYILVNSGLWDFLHDNAKGGPVQTPIDTFCHYLRLIIPQLTTAFDGIELVWVNTTPVNEGIIWDVPDSVLSYYANNDDRDEYNDSARNIFRTFGFYKEISHDSLIAEHGWAADTTGGDGIHWSETAGSYAAFASNIKQHLEAWGTYFNGLEMTHCEYMCNAALLADTSLSDDSLAPTYSPSYDRYTRVVDGAFVDSLAGAPWKSYNTSGGGSIVSNVDLILGDKSGTSIEIAMNMPEYTFRSILRAYIDDNTSLTLYTYANSLFVRYKVGGTQVVWTTVSAPRGVDYVVYFLQDKARATRVDVRDTSGAMVSTTNWTTYGAADTVTTFPNPTYGTTTAFDGGGQIYHVAVYNRLMEAEQCSTRAAALPALSTYDLVTGTTDTLLYLSDGAPSTDSVHITEFDLVGSFTFPPDSVYIDGAKATISGSSVNGFTAVPATPLMWDRSRFDVKIYQLDSYCSYNWLYYNRRILESRLNTGVGF